MQLDQKSHADGLSHGDVLLLDQSECMSVFEWRVEICTLPPSSFLIINFFLLSSTFYSPAHSKNLARGAGVGDNSIRTGS